MSTADTIAAAVVGVLNGIGLLPAPTVVYRKLPTVLSGDSGIMPVIVVSVSGEGESELLWKQRALFKYPVSITIVSPSPGLTAGAADAVPVRQWRDQIRAALYGNVLGVGENNVAYRGEGAWDKTAMNDQFVYSSQVFTVEMIEARP